MPSTGPCRYLANAIVAMALCASALPGNAQPRYSEEELLSLESPVVASLMRRAAQIERHSTVINDLQFVARMYCAASRLGSAEAQFRLGKMLLEGRGIRKSLDRAATLFSIASGNGHEGARSMLATTGIRRINLPECLNELENNFDRDASDIRNIRRANQLA